MTARLSLRTPSGAARFSFAVEYVCWETEQKCVSKSVSFLTPNGATVSPVLWTFSGKLTPDSMEQVREEGEGRGEREEGRWMDGGREDRGLRGEWGGNSTKNKSVACDGCKLSLCTGPAKLL